MTNILVTATSSRRSLSYYVFLDYEYSTNDQGEQRYNTESNKYWRLSEDHLEEKHFGRYSLLVRIPFLHFLIITLYMRAFTLCPESSIQTNVI